MKKYIKQLGYLLISLRPKQHIKNIILFVPLVFSSLLLNIDSVEKTSLIFILFSLFAGSTYIINDYKDREKDKNHAKKKNRPLASGKLNPNFALIGAIIIGLASLYFSYSVG
jgi:4-hydroxybenzoate polyprenyltransferase